MNRPWVQSVALGVWAGMMGLALAVEAIPGQSTDEAVLWIQQNPVLDPAPGETLLVRKDEPDGSRFTFQAQVAPPGRIVNPLDRETIRSELMTFFEPAGLTPDDLGAAIETIYGPDIAADYAQSQQVLAYPSAAVLNEPTTDQNFLKQAIQGVIRQGNRFVYRLELTQNQDGSVQQGRIEVFEPEWLPKIEQELAETYDL